MAAYQQQVAAQPFQSARAQKEQQAKVLRDAFLKILNLHRAEFAPAARPVVPPPAPPDRAAILKQYEQHALAGVSVFNRRGRKEARERAAAWADGEVARLWANAQQVSARWQQYYDERWRLLCANDADVVIDTLDEAFEDNEAPSAALGVEGDEVTLVVLVPRAELAVPEQLPTRTQAGNVSLRKITQPGPGRFLQAVRLRACASHPGGRLAQRRR